MNTETALELGHSLNLCLGSEHFLQQGIELYGCRRPQSGGPPERAGRSSGAEQCTCWPGDLTADAQGPRVVGPSAALRRGTQVEGGS